MKLNQECVRDILLTIEDQPFDGLIEGIRSEDLRNMDRLSKYSVDDLYYCSLLLIQAEYISGKQTMVDMLGVPVFEINGLTWQGHKFLDTVRDPKVWSDTKKVLKRFSSVSLTMTENIASKVILGLIKQETNLPL